MNPLAISLLLPTLLPHGQVPTKPPQPKLLIQAKALAARLDGEDLRILDTRSAREYEAGHIPGAIRIDVKKWSVLAHKRDGLANPKPWAEIVGKLGIDGKHTVVVYGMSVPNTARAWWTLAYLGVGDVRVLDGGFSRWTKLGLPLDKARPSVEAKRFVPKLQVHRLARIDEVKAACNDDRITLVDARSDAEFAGTRGGGKRVGHIPGAVHLEWKHLVAADGRFKSPAELRKLFEKAGLARGKTFVPY